MQVNFPKNQHFCDLYWQKLKSLGQLREGAVSSLSHTWKLSNINCLFAGTTKDTSFLNGYYNIPKVIRETDIEFRSLRPINENMTLWRGITKQSENVPASEFFKQSLKLKKGDSIRLPGYIYASYDKNTAETFGNINSEFGILYKINVSAGSQIYQEPPLYSIFPRNSKFICTDSVIVNGMSQPYKLVSLDYVNTKNQ